jgi:hypothetical protein
MAPRDYYAIVEGYTFKKRREAELLRLSVWAAKSTWEGEINFHTWKQRFFPLWFDEKEEEAAVIEMTQEDIKEIFKRHDKYHGRLAGNEHSDRG